MASDIPFGYDTPDTMARSLATYLTCPEEIRKRVMGVFTTCPSRPRISQMIAKHRKPAIRTGPVCLGDGYYPNEARGRLDRVNKEFLVRLEIERRASVLEVA